MSEQKTLITNAKEGKARFLNYDICVSWNNSAQAKVKGGKRRSVNGHQKIYVRRNSLIERLLAETCELCGKEHVPLSGHHIRKLKDLHKKWKGREKPEWVKKMIAIRRKSLFVCNECHQKIHAGTYDGKRLT